MRILNVSPRLIEIVLSNVRECISSDCVSVSDWKVLSGSEIMAEDIDEIRDRAREDARHQKEMARSRDFY
jgi:hypothetical protein